MTATTTSYRLGEFHQFAGGGRDFLYLVPAGAIFEMDQAVADVVKYVAEHGVTSREELAGALVEQGQSFEEAIELADELIEARVIVASDVTHELLDAPPADFPLQSLVM